MGNAGQQGERFPQQEQERRERRSKPTFVKLLRPLPVPPVCTSNEIKVKGEHGGQQTIHISKDLMPQGQKIPHLAAIQSECEEEGEEEGSEIFSTSDQDLCPVCQRPLPNSPQKQNWTNSYHPVSGSSRSEAEHLQTSGAAHLSSAAPAHHLPSSCPHQPLPSSPATAYPACNEQVICPDCWPLVRPVLI